MKEVRIEEVKIRLHDETDDALIGWASCIVNEAIYLNNIAIVRGEDGLRLSYPSTRSQSDARHFHFNPISRDAQQAFEEAILGKLGAIGGS